MLTRVLLALVLISGTAAAGMAEEAKVLALGITDHAPTQEELEKGDALPQPKFNTAAVAYALTAGLKKGDVVELNFNNEGKSLMHNNATLAGDAAAIDLWMRSIKALACALGSLINVIDPEAIIIGGGIAQAGVSLFAPLRVELAKVEWRPAGHSVDLRPAQLGEWARAIGAARTALDGTPQG